MDRLVQLLCYAIWLPGLFVLDAIGLVIPVFRKYTYVYLAPIIGLSLWVLVIGCLVWLL